MEVVASESTHQFQPQLALPIPPAIIPTLKPPEQYSFSFQSRTSQATDSDASQSEDDPNRKRKKVRKNDNADAQFIQQISNLSTTTNNNPIGWLEAVGALAQILASGIDNITSNTAEQHTIRKEKARIESITKVLASSVHKLRAAAGSLPPHDELQTSLDEKLTTLTSKVDALSKVLTSTGTKTYANATTQGSHRPNPPNKSTSTKKEPSNPNNENRFVLRFKGNPLPPAERIRSEDAVRRLNNRIAKEGGGASSPEVLAAMLKPNGNYIIKFTNKIPAEIDQQIKHLIKEELAPTHQTAEASRDRPWTKVVVHNISTTDADDIPRSMESIGVDLKRNPILRDIVFTQDPRWIHPPQRMAGKLASAISFAFEDDGTVLQQLLKHNIYVFGLLTRVERWNERPKNPQCKKCWSLKHNTSNCNKTTTTCRVCGKTGALERDHRSHCDECKRSNNNDGTCRHMCCVNCHQLDHCADDPKCPKLLNAGPRTKTNTPTQPKSRNS